MRDRKFGVEIECGFRVRPRGPQSRDENSRACRRVLQDAVDAQEIPAAWLRNIGHDGTLMEIRSPILQGIDGFKQLHTVMEILRENGGYVTSADGMHVHHDAPEYVDDPEAVLRLIRSWRSNLPVIHGMVAARRRSSGACPRWSDAQESNVEKFANDGKLVIKSSSYYYGRSYDRTYSDFKDYSWDRHDLNISALKEHGTIEIRLHQGTLDPVQAEAWIRFGQSLLNKVISVRHPVRPVSDVDDLFHILRTPLYTRRAKDKLNFTASLRTGTTSIAAV